MIKNFIRLVKEEEAASLLEYTLVIGAAALAATTFGPFLINQLNAVQTDASGKINSFLNPAP